jgi:indole-3-glycerol phosphate synthase
MNILDTIVAQKKREISLLPPGPVTADELRRILAARGERRDFLGALQSRRPGTVALIAEVKKASPSAGVISRDFDPVRVAREYEAAGASCLSVLTDEKFFQGSARYLSEIRAAVKLPLLRKDFIIDERQVREAAGIGADAILLIARILEGGLLQHLHSLATEAGLTVLVEVHDEAELDRALAIGARLIGVNSRDLDTFKVDLGVTGRVAAKMAGRPGAAGRVLVAESGLHTRADVVRVQKAGAGAILVGEALLRNPAGIAAKVSELLTDN